MNAETWTTTTNAPKPARSPAVAPQAPTIPPETWALYLAELAEYGTKWKCLTRAGLTRKDLNARLAEDVEFRDQVDHAMDLCADRLEELLVAPGLDKRNVVGLIVRLKALRPNQYIERQVSTSISVNATVTVTDAEAFALLQKMLRDAQPHTVAALTEGSTGR